MVNSGNRNNNEIEKINQTTVLEVKSIGLTAGVRMGMESEKPEMVLMGLACYTRRWKDGGIISRKTGLEINLFLFRAY